MTSAVRKRPQTVVFFWGHTSHEIQFTLRRCVARHFHGGTGESSAHSPRPRTVLDDVTAFGSAYLVELKGQHAG